MVSKDEKASPLGSAFSRRGLLKAAGATAVGAAVAGFGGSLNPKESQPVVVAQEDEDDFEWDDEFDVVVVGSGGAASSAGVTAAEHGASVVMLEKSDLWGGTTGHSGGGSWVPNNTRMIEEGNEDSLEDTLRYCARVCFPQYYDADGENYGLSELHYDRLRSFVFEAADVFEWLEDIEALVCANDPTYPLYYGGIAEAQDISMAGQLLFPLDEEGTPSNGGEMIRQFRAALEDRDVDLRTEHRVVRLVQDEDGRVLGVEAETADGDTVRIRGEAGVIFGTGGFANNRDMAFAYLRGPIFGGGAPASNQGDFVHIANSIGAEFSNMQHAWLAESVLDDAADADGRIPTISLVPGDSMIYVNRFGHRVVDEKMQYQDRTHAHFNWDPIRAEYTNLVLFKIYDEHTATRFPGRYPIPVDSNDAEHVVVGETLEELAENIQAKLQQFSSYTGNMQLDEHFVNNLRGTIGAFNQFAETGEDRHFLRGSTPIETHNHTMMAGGEIDHDYPNPTMHPISDEGPYYAILIVASSFDTKGGPMTDTVGRILNSDGEPIPGLYGAGNCVAAPVGQSYPGPGATLGPAITYGYLAAMHAVEGVELSDDDEPEEEDDEPEEDDEDEEIEEEEEPEEDESDEDGDEDDDEDREAQNHRVEVTDDLTFEPEHLTIRAGDSVTWVNVGQMVHTATGDPDRAFDEANAVLPDGAESWHSGNMDPGDEFTHTFDVAGEYTYACIPHEVAGQVGSITVED
jgi:3-oxosteroid 1-dehydrogenase